MDSLKQDLFANFAFGTIAAAMTIEGEGVKKRPEMLANIFAYVSKGVYKRLIPGLSNYAQSQELLPGSGDQVIDEQVKVELLGFTVTLDLKVQLSIEIPSPMKETIRFQVVEIVGPEVINDAVGRVAGRLNSEVIEEHYKQNPEEAGPFGSGGLDALFGRALGGNASVVGVMPAGDRPLL